MTRLVPLSLLATGCASQPSAQAPASTPRPQASRAVVPAATPAAIAVPSGQRVLLKASAKGVQIYVCKAAESAPRIYEWTLEAPEADLFDEEGQKIGRHYVGPTWQSTDGSKVVGKLRSHVDAPDATAVPWLLLDVKSTEGTGIFSKVKYIQRVETSGGKAPASGCDADRTGAEMRVDYTATYYMYGM